MELAVNFDAFASKETILGYLVRKFRISMDLDSGLRLISEHAHTVRFCPLSSIFSHSNERDFAVST